MGTLERLGIDRSWMCTPEWQPFKWYAKINHKSEKIERPRLLVTWTETQGYVFQESIVKELNNPLTSRVASEFGAPKFPGG